MNAIEFAYIIGFSLSILTLLPVIYGVFVDGLTTKIKQSFFALLVISFGWTITQLLQIAVDGFEMLLILEVVTTVFLCLSAYINYIFTVIYTDTDWLLQDKWVVPSVIPFIIFGINLIYKRFRYEPNIHYDSFIHLEYPLNFIDIGFVVFVFLLYVVIFMLLFKAYYEKSLRYKSIPLFAFGLLIPLLFGFISYTPGAPVPQLNHAPLGFPVLSISLAIAVFGFDMLEIEPIALERFAEELPDPVFILNDEKEIIHKNKAANNLVEAESPLADNDDFFSLPFDSDKLREAFEKDKNQEVFEFEVASRKENKVFTLTNSIVCHDGVLLGWVVHMKDVTELEEQKEELKRQNEQLQRFSDGVTHELRNPLSVASQYTELYFESEEENEELIKPDKAHRKISNAHNRIDEIIENVEWLSKDGQTITQTEQVSLKEASEEVWDSLEKNSGANLSVETEKQVIANKTRLKSAFDNLFKNSLRYASPDPDITVRVVDNKLYIEDDGPGIPEDKVEQIFEYGYTTSQEGTGFGLPVVKTIVESHGWTIKVDPSYESGARFVISGIQIE